MLFNQIINKRIQRKVRVPMTGSLRALEWVHDVELRVSMYLSAVLGWLL